MYPIPTISSIPWKHVAACLATAWITWRVAGVASSPPPPADCPAAQVVSVVRSKTVTRNKDGSTTTSVAHTPVVSAGSTSGTRASTPKAGWRAGVDVPVRRDVQAQDAGIAGAVRIGNSPAWLEGGWRPKTGEVRVGATWEW